MNCTKCLVLYGEYGGGGTLLMFSAAEIPLNCAVCFHEPIHTKIVTWRREAFKK